MHPAIVTLVHHPAAVKTLFTTSMVGNTSSPGEYELWRSTHTRACQSLQSEASDVAIQRQTMSQIWITHRLSVRHKAASGTGTMTDTVKRGRDLRRSLHLRTGSLITRCASK